MKKLVYIAASFLALSTVFQSCKSDELSPGFEFMPDMYRSPALEAYAGNSFYEDSMASRKPVVNTISRGYMPYMYPNTNEGYAAAGAELQNPIPFNDAVLAEGKELYSKFCQHCHGTKGQGDGPTVTKGGYPPPPSYSGQLKDLEEGKMFHTITYGKNLMGSHASQVTTEERWKIIHYVQMLQDSERKLASVQNSDNQ